MCATCSHIWHEHGEAILVCAQGAGVGSGSSHGGYTQFLQIITDLPFPLFNSPYVSSILVFPSPHIHMLLHYHLKAQEIDGESRPAWYLGAEV